MSYLERAGRRPSRHWTVRVSFPESCTLSASDRTMTTYAIHKVFADGWVDICTLRDLRRLLKPHAAAADVLESQLRLVHCEQFDRLPPEVTDVVPELIGAYLGVTVERIIEDAEVTALRVFERAAEALPA